jgi:hypothetical protein
MAWGYLLPWLHVLGMANIILAPKISACKVSGRIGQLLPGAWSRFRKTLTAVR